MKTSQDVLNDIFSLINVPVVQLVIEKLFKGNKPDSYKGECVTTNVLYLSASQLQNGIVNVNVHVPNLQFEDENGNSSMPNYERLNAISKVICDQVKDGLANGTLTAIDAMRTFEENEINETYVNIRVATSSPNLEPHY